MEDDAGKKKNRWVPLEGANTIAQAQAQLNTPDVDRTRNDLPVLKRTPQVCRSAANATTHCLSTAWSNC